MISLHEKVIDLQGTVLGFKHLQQFVYEQVAENSPFGYLRSLEDETIGFVVASPFDFFKNYEFKLEDADKTKLSLDRAEDALVLGIITLQEPFRRSTMNLIAPVVINIGNMMGCQVVLPPNSEYKTKTRLFPPPEQEESGESAC